MKRPFARQLGLTIGLTIGLTGVALVQGAREARADGVMLQGFYWDTTSPDSRSWWDYLSDHARELRDWGVTSLWVPPPTKGAGGGYSNGYDMFDPYDLGSKDQMSTIPTRFGTKAQFLDLVGIAHGNGLEIYADIIVNHRSGGHDRGYDFSHVKGAEGQGRMTMGPWDFHQNGRGDWDEDLIGMRDIAQENPATRDKLFSWIKWFDKQTGLDGYRIDATKHMNPQFVEGLLYQVQEGLGPNRHRFAVGEYYDGNPNTLQWWVNAVNRRSSTFDFQLFFNLHSMAHGKGYYDMRGLRGRFWDETRAVSFVNNHDTFERGNGLQTFERADLAYAFILAAPGYPCVYWKDLYDNNGNAREYLKNLMWISHTFARGQGIERWADDDLYVMEREGNLLAGLNDNTSGWRTEWVRTSFGSNVHLHDYSGHQPDRWTNQDGWVQISVPPSSYVMYARDGMQTTRPTTPSRRTTQEYEGNVDMDMPRLSEKWSAPIRVAVEKGKPIKVEVYLEDKSLAAHVCLIDKDGKRLNHARGVGSVKLEFLNPPTTGFYQVRVGLELTGQNKKTPYWTKIDYQAPMDRPTAYPVPGSEDKNVLPLISTSRGP